MHITFKRFFSIMVYHRIFSIVLCGVGQYSYSGTLPIHSTRISFQDVAFLGDSFRCGQ